MGLDDDELISRTVRELQDQVLVYRRGLAMRRSSGEPVTGAFMVGYLCALENALVLLGSAPPPSTEMMIAGPLPPFAGVRYAQSQLVLAELEKKPDRQRRSSKTETRR
jgi:hypothetical protein